MHEHNSYITLTYNNQHLPYDLSLNLRHFQLFMKRLRKKYCPNVKYYDDDNNIINKPIHKIKMFHCGEYGDDESRPHYHALIFGHDWADKKFFKMSHGYPLYRSAALEALWPFGYSTVGELTFESAAYVARYCMKKINGEMADEHYQREVIYTDPTTGEISTVTCDVMPEYTTMSQGIGTKWLKQYKTDVYPDDFMIINNKKSRPPRFYDKLLEITDPKLMRRIRARRIKNGKKHSEDKTPARLRVRERVLEAKLKRLPRDKRKHT